MGAVQTSIDAYLLINVSICSRINFHQDQFELSLSKMFDFSGSTEKFATLIESD